MSKSEFQGTVYIDIPDADTVGTDDGGWKNIHTAMSVKEAVAWIRENIGPCDDEGNVCLLTLGEPAAKGRCITPGESATGVVGVERSYPGHSKEILSPEKRDLRMNIRNFLLTATPAELQKELEISNDRGDKFRAMCIVELLNEQADSVTHRWFVMVEKHYVHHTGRLKKLTGVIEIQATTLEAAQDIVDAMMGPQDDGSKCLQTIDPRITWDEDFEEGDGWEYVDWSFAVIR